MLSIRHKPPSCCSGGSNGGNGAAALANDVLLLVMRCCMDAPVVAKQWMLQGYQARRMPTTLRGLSTPKAHCCSQRSHPLSCDPSQAMLTINVW